MGLNKEQKERYNRQIILEQIGEAGQERLLDSKVLVVGIGGLGSPVAIYLTAAGVGTIGIMDNDKVELTNLQRQIIHFTGDVGIEKIASAKEKMESINPDIAIKTYPQRASAENIREIVREYDFVIDATDNLPSKFLINDACYFEKVAFTHAGIFKFEGQVMTVLPGESACYRCVFKSLPAEGSLPPASQVGVLGVVPGVIGLLEATEAIKYLLGVGDLLTDRLLRYDALRMEFRKVGIKRNVDCRLCGEKPEITELKDEQ